MNRAAAPGRHGRGAVIMFHDAGGNRAQTVAALPAVIAGLRAEQSGRELALQALFGALLGLLIIALRLVLH